MKNIIVAFSFLLIGITAFSQNKNAKATVEVDGVCQMCKQRIEKAAIKAKGVKMADWNVSTHQLNLIYNEEKTDLSKIQRSIAESGHDTEDFKAPESAYESIDDCCKYRDPQVLEDHSDK